VNYLKFFFTGSLHQPHSSPTLLQQKLPTWKALFSNITLGKMGAHNPISSTVDEMYTAWLCSQKWEFMTSLSHLTTGLVKMQYTGTLIFQVGSWGVGPTTPARG
jgi:hypothetical protein